MIMLSLEKLTKSFGGLTAVSNVDMSVEEGELIGLIGPNGAGKTTIFNLITGVYLPSYGSIEFEKDDKMLSLVKKKPYRVTSYGIARTFQNIRLFKDLSVLDNVRIAMHRRIGYGLPTAVSHFGNYFSEEGRVISEAEALLDVFGLTNKKNELAKNLPYGEQRHLEIVRAMATKPKLLLLDEPAAGMNPNETKDLTDMIAHIRKDYGLTILLIEHDMSLVMKICERIYVLDYGVVIANGTPDEIRHDKRVIEAYLGEDLSVN
jgi:branched-chain amino acid transport system ATP-binding protein